MIIFMAYLAFFIFLFLMNQNINKKEEIHMGRLEIDKCDSYIERKLYLELKKNGFNPVPQVKCGPYKIDLALYRYNLAIECDGKAYHSSPEQRRHDARKNRYLKKNGWKVCRLSGKTINSNLGYAINHIKKRIARG